MPFDDFVPSAEERGEPTMRLTVRKHPEIVHAGPENPVPVPPSLDPWGEPEAPAPIPEDQNPFTHHQELQFDKDTGSASLNWVPNPKPEDTPLSPPTPRIPGAFLDRLTQGTAFDRIAKAAAEGAKRGYNPSEPIGFSAESEEALRKLGVFRDPERNLGGPLRLANEALMRPAAATLDFAFRVMNAIPNAIGYGIAQAGEEVGFKKATPEAKEEVATAVNFTGLLLGTHPVYRVGTNPKAPMKDEKIGALPSPQDFIQAAHVMSDGEPSPKTVAKLQRLWEERGIHPSEVAHDAEVHPNVKAELLSNDTELPSSYYDMKGITVGQTVPKNWKDWENRPIETRILPNGRIVPAPNTVATWLRKFGEKAGFKFMVGPGNTEGQMGMSSRLVGGPGHASFRDRETKQVGSYVYLPQTAEELNRRWYGLGQYEIAAHEVGHALDHWVLNDGTGHTETLSHLSPEIKAEMETASREFRPLLWERAAAHNQKPSEYMADAIAAYITNPTRRALMPEFAKKFGGRLDEYVEIAEQSLPRKIDGEWVPPGEEPPAGGAGGGGGIPPAHPGQGNPKGEEPKRLPGPEGDLKWAREQIDKKLSVGEGDPRQKWSLERLYTNVVDQFFPVSKTTKELAGGKDNLPVSDDPYKLFRLFMGSAGKAEHFLHHGTYDFNTYSPTGKSLDEILKPVRKDLADFRRFVAAARSAELEARGITTGFNQEAVQIFGRAKRKEYQQTFKELVEYQNKLTEYLRDSGVLSKQAYDAMLDANHLFVPFHVVLDPEQFSISRVGNTMEAHNPVRRIEGSLKKRIDPLESIIKNTYLLTAMAEKNYAMQKLVNLLKAGSHAAGSASREIVPMGRTATPETSKAVSEWIGHNGGPKLDPLEDLMSEYATPERDGHISVYFNGKRETYKVDEDLARAVKGLDRSYLNFIERLMAGPAKMLRAGAVLDPEFAARHLMRDFIYAFIKYPGKGVFTPYDTARGLSSLIFKDRHYWDWLQSGGGQVNYMALDRNYMQENLDDLLRVGAFTKAWNTVVDPAAPLGKKAMAVGGLPKAVFDRGVIRPLQFITDLALSANHLGGYRKAIDKYERTGNTLPAIPGQGRAGATKSQKLDAAWTSRETGIDTARIGAAMHSWNAYTAFGNATIQDTAQVITAMKDRPATTTLRIVAGIVAPSVLLYAAFHKDSRVKNAPQWQKDTRWLIPIDHWEPTTASLYNMRKQVEPDMVRVGSDGKYYQNTGAVFSLPKPFSTGVLFGSGTERLLDAYFGENPHAFDGFAKELLATTAGHLAPTVLSPIFDQMTNRSSFTGAPIIPAAQVKGLPEYQFNDYTTETAKAAGKFLADLPTVRQLSLSSDAGLTAGAARSITSPILIESYVRNWTGPLGFYTLQALDKGLRSAGVVPEQKEFATKTIADIPFVRAFVLRHPAMGTQAVERFFDYYNVKQAEFHTWQRMAHEGDTEAMLRIQKIGGPSMFQKLDGFAKTLSSISKAIHSVNINPNMKADEKRQLIDSFYYQFISVGNAADMTVDQLRRAEKSEP